MLLLIAVLSAAPAAGPSCQAYERRPAPAGITADARLVTAASGKAATASGIDAILHKGDWRIIWARPADSEPGAFVFRGSRSVDVWGGVTSDRAGAARWAKKLGVPDDLARCFADRLVRQGP